MITPSKKYDHSFSSRHETNGLEVEIKFNFNSRFPASPVSNEIIQACIDSAIAPLLKHLLLGLQAGIDGIRGGSV